MNDNYLKLTLEELIEDREFISWVLKGSNSTEWEKRIADNPAFKPKAYKAREIVLLLRDTYSVLKEDDVVNIWQNVERFDKLHLKKARSKKIKNTISWAAIVVFLVAFSSLAYLYHQKLNLGYSFAENSDISGFRDTKLVLSSGEEIQIKKENSKISVNRGDELIIGTDSVIDLRQINMFNEGEVQMNEVITPYGKTSELVLADGTRVSLNAGSRFAFPSKFQKKNREVYLEGEAYFEVARNTKQPFIVKTTDLDVEVLGTSFDVSAYPTDNNIETVLLEGSVEISKPALLGFSRDVIKLEPNQKARFNKKSKDVKVSDEPDADAYIAWTAGWFQFSKQSLKDVFASLERYYNVKIVVSDSFPSEELISGKLDLKESIEEVMFVLNDVAKLKYKLINNTLYIEKIPVRD